MEDEGKRPLLSPSEEYADNSDEKEVYMCVCVVCVCLLCVCVVWCVYVCVFCVFVFV